ncbi:MAG TPA: MarC family protein, partial [Armatimonadota bacterium]|nr:MarC family protein [Armatimonadota bacterium]
MSEETIQTLRILVQSTAVLLIVLDPFGLLPLVVAVTGKMSNKQRQRMLTRAVLIAFALLLVFAFAGTLILSLFKITLEDLKVGGGLLLLVIALSIVVGGHSQSEPTPD